MKAFTLVELVAVIILVGILCLISLPTVNKTIRLNKENLYSAQIAEIKESASKWAYKNLDLLPEIEGKSISITLEDLKKSGLIKLDLKDPRTKELLPNDMIIVITLKNNKYEIKVIEDSGTNVTDKITENSPIIVLNGNNIEYVELNDTYVELGAKSKSKDGNILQVNIQYKLEGSEKDKISTGLLKTYTVTYSATSNYNGNNYTSYIVRTVIIRDTTPPNLILPPDITITPVESNSFNIMNGVSATDNNLETVNITSEGYNPNIEKNIVSYKACDTNNNCVTKKRIINIK